MRTPTRPLAASALALAAGVFAGTAAPAATAAPPAADLGHHEGKHAKKDLVGTALENGSFTTLLAAAEAAGLVETLKSEGPYTLLAPTDAAFAKLPAGAIADLLKPENKEKLKSVLLYHVVDGKALAEDVSGMSEVETLEGSMVEVSTEDGKVMLNDATVEAADVMASNGVIHVIDTVLMPEG
ncbi:fasciclin domain-containing protein [Phycisphaera mikurensis]|uniref:FAS1 domain-containing protein n=1 Tax=Phycisphaera mikurensis (strain NBRC 102666 / KCTC 22515 / FYK2301M01) TaxID=1142394 RepID=I0ID84_PHYMF|nr:fasciclin domain-containing protein [Phycisphaera mikurensis]MBB6442347.1 putative surface protein with fasciclin (FAS1) repeats [Phycisphaera mikurensis]BAM03222.1 hypothetical protein PSMK_10630 [Phycisphaera mikurensis NBRC 102666]